MPSYYRQYLQHWRKKNFLRPVFNVSSKKVLGSTQSYRHFYFLLKKTYSSLSFFSSTRWKSHNIQFNQFLIINLYHYCVPYWLICKSNEFCTYVSFSFFFFLFPPQKSWYIVLLHKIILCRSYKREKERNGKKERKKKFFL